MGIVINILWALVAIYLSIDLGFEWPLFFFFILNGFMVWLGFVGINLICRLKRGKEESNDEKTLKISC